MPLIKIAIWWQTISNHPESCIYIYTAVHITYPIKYPIANYVIVVLSVLH